MGAILRSACAFGAAGIIVQKRHAPELSGPAGGIMAKTACGAMEHTPIAYETNLSRSIEALQEAGYFVYGLDERGEDMPRDTPSKAVLVLGAEGEGLRHLVKEKCDVLVKLPTSGPIASLNVSNAAAVALYAFRGAK
jgi:23S rRNA (guanosine2251-2'-O)-methyltransferase